MKEELSIAENEIFWSGSDETTMTESSSAGNVQRNGSNISRSTHVGRVGRRNALTCDRAFRAITMVIGSSIEGIVDRCCPA